MPLAFIAPNNSSSVLDPLQNQMEDFDLSQLPLHLLTQIVEKLTYKECAKLDQASRLAHDICSAKKYAFRHVVPQIFVEKTGITVHTRHYDVEPTMPYEFFADLPIKLCASNIVLSGQVDSDRMSEYSLLFEKNGTTGKVLKLTDEIKFKPEDLERMIEITSVSSSQYFTCDRFLPRGFLRWKGLQNMEYLYTEGTDCTDDELLALKATDMCLTTDFVTSKGLNKLLKQWKRKEREIESVGVIFDASIGSRNFDDILEGIDANPLWTPDMHGDSILSAIPMNELDFVYADDPMHLYSIWRSDELEKTVILQLTKERFRAFEYFSESQFLKSRLTSEEMELFGFQE